MVIVATVGAARTGKWLGTAILQGLRRPKSHRKPDLEGPAKGPGIGPGRRDQRERRTGAARTDSPSCGLRADVQEARRARPFRERKAGAPGPSRVARERAAKRATKPGKRPALRCFGPRPNKEQVRADGPASAGPEAGVPGRGEVAWRASPEGWRDLLAVGSTRERGEHSPGSGKREPLGGWAEAEAKDVLIGGGGRESEELGASWRRPVAEPSPAAEVAAGTPPARRSGARVRSYRSDRSVRARGLCPRAGWLGWLVLG